MAAARQGVPTPAPAAATSWRPLLSAALLVTVLAAVLPDGAFADPRSTVRLRYACHNELGRRDVTLFANGTVRLRQGLWATQEMYLDELHPAELESYLVQLATILEPGPGSRPPTSIAPDVVRGDWVEQCEILVALPDRNAQTFHFSPTQVPPLQVQNLIIVAEDLALFTRPLDTAERLPADYEPRRGDVLRTAEGLRYKVLGKTSDGRALEFEGVEQPVRMFVPLSDLHSSFVALEKPDER